MRDDLHRRAAETSAELLLMAKAMYAAVEAVAADDIRARLLRCRNLIDDLAAALGVNEAKRIQAIEEEREACAKAAESVAMNIKHFENDILYPNVLGRNEASKEIALIIRRRGHLHAAT